MVPAVNQIEVHPYFRQSELLAVDDEHGILNQAWSPIGGITFYREGPHGSTLEDPVIGEIAAAHGKTPAQVMLRWHLQQGRQVIPKSVTPSRIAENFDVFDFELTARATCRHRRTGHRCARRPGARSHHPRELRHRNPRSLSDRMRNPEHHLTYERGESTVTGNPPGHARRRFSDMGAAGLAATPLLAGVAGCTTDAPKQDSDGNASGMPTNPLAAATTVTGRRTLALGGLQHRPEVARP